MNAQEIVKFVEAAGLELYLEGERLRYRAPSQPDPELLNLVIQHKQDIIKILEKKSTVPRLPWQLERLLHAASSGVLRLHITGVPDTTRYVLAWGCEYLAGDSQEALKRLWEVYQAWQPNN
jgi:hypothetical protein